MSVDEVVALVVAGFCGVVRWGLWYRRSYMVSDALSPRSSRAALFLAPMLGAALLLAILLFFAARDVRDSAIYLTFYMVLGAGWVGVASAVLALFGLRPAEDVAQRRNGAAGVAAIGALLALTLAFAGANIGDGPGWWVVLFSAALSTAGLLGVWAIVEWTTGVTDMVTIDRDAAAGVRLASVLIAAGAIQGRAVAGDWVSAEATLRDWLTLGWPVLGLVLLETVVGRMHGAFALRERPSVATLGLVPGALYLLGASAYILSLGWWT